MEAVQSDVQPQPTHFSRARVAVFYIVVSVLSIAVCMVAAAFAALGYELDSILMETGSTPFFGEIGMGIGAILGLAAAIIWCRRILAIERTANRRPKPIVSAVVLALIATVVLHLSLMFLQAYLRNAPLQVDGLGFGAIFGIPAALISGAILGSVGYYVLGGKRWQAPPMNGLWVMPTEPGKYR